MTIDVDNNFNAIEIAAGRLRKHSASGDEKNEKFSLCSNRGVIFWGAAFVFPQGVRRIRKAGRAVLAARREQKYLFRLPSFKKL